MLRKVGFYLIYNVCVCAYSATRWQNSKGGIPPSDLEVCPRG